MEKKSPKMAVNSISDPKPGSGEIVLNVVSTDGEKSLALLKTLMKSAKSAPRIVWHATLDEALKSGTKLPVLFVIAGADIAVSSAVDAGKTPTAALEDWKQQSRDLLRQLRKVRRNVLLIEQAALQFRMKDCADKLGERLGLQFDSRPVKASDETLSVRDKGLVLLVRTLLQQDPEAQAMAEEFEALAVGGTYERVINGVLVDDLFLALEERELLLKHIELFQNVLPAPGSVEAANGEIAKYETALIDLALQDGLTIGRQQSQLNKFAKIETDLATKK